jgi:NAD(P)-dependent dehydrogenase (short-subunit alcohol dehydrogenase family)
MRGLEGKVAIVTGGGHGIGRASAIRLADEGAHVVVVDIDGDAARRVAASLATESAGMAGSIASEADTDAYLELAVSRFGRVDLHHLNAGISGSFARLVDLSVADFDEVMSVNLRGTFLGLRAAFRRFTAQDGAGAPGAGAPGAGAPGGGASGGEASGGEASSGGAICITASIASLRGSADLLPYQTSKHGVLGLLHGAAVYGGPLGIRVNAVAPGIVPTELFAAAAATPGGKNDMAARAATTPLRRAGTPADIAGVVAFLLSDDAGYVTGEVVSADGGATTVSTVRPSGGAGAWDTDAADRRTYG